MSTTSPRWEDLREGEGAPPRTVGPITRTDFVRYQGASGDMNPVHHDETFARAAGYEAPLGVGMFHAGVMATWATDWLGAENVRSFKVRWREAVWPGDVLTFEGRVVRKYEEGARAGEASASETSAGETSGGPDARERRVDVEMVCRRERGGVAAQAWATFVVDR